MHARDLGGASTVGEGDGELSSGRVDADDGAVMAAPIWREVDATMRAGSDGDDRGDGDGDGRCHDELELKLKQWNIFRLKGMTKIVGDYEYKAQPLIVHNK
ncbi:hypothetical protein B0H17DRAFT_1140362 [Mycena rosella]|uniref:Uncharacterized protein n=1 Tax=Mycena rosella TaxID=1033263 RepID=A0AAD7D5X2_MYCRO|nr:hypothetical protein B0H17DRAFT_1140362 [Mycena rosella]